MTDALSIADQAVALEDFEELNLRNDLKPIRTGKVRQLYLYQQSGQEELLMLATDQISAYDVVLPTPIPGKGQVLTEMSKFWFGETEHIVPNHYIDDASDDLPKKLLGRAMRVHHLEMHLVECVVRGYLSGSAWREYQATGEVCGIRLPRGLQESQKLDEPIFTPATKAEGGAHDENIDFDQASDLVPGGRRLMDKLRDASIALYLHASAHAAKQGIILADTKFEFGRSPEEEIVLADEVLTPDSSRFWPVDDFEPGRAQRSFDKQFVRDWLDETPWNRTPDDAPELPEAVVRETRQKYIDAYQRIVTSPVPQRARAAA